MMMMESDLVCVVVMVVVVVGISMWCVGISAWEWE